MEVILWKKEIIMGKTLEEKLAIADEIGRGYFRQGLNCTECVLKTFMDMYDTDLPEEILCMATGFGGGIGHTKIYAAPLPELFWPWAQ